MGFLQHFERNGFRSMVILSPTLQRRTQGGWGSMEAQPLSLSMVFRGFSAPPPEKKNYVSPPWTNSCVHRAPAPNKNKGKIFSSNITVVLAKIISVNHRLINKTNRTLDVVFYRFRSFSFTITLRQKPKEVTRMLSLCRPFNAACA